MGQRRDRLLESAASLGRCRACQADTRFGDDIRSVPTLTQYNRCLNHHCPKTRIRALMRVHVSSLFSSRTNEMLYVGWRHRTRYGRVLPNHLHQQLNGHQHASPVQEAPTGTTRCSTVSGVLEKKKRILRAILRPFVPVHGDTPSEKFNKLFKHARGPYTAFRRLPHTPSAIVSKAKLLPHISRTSVTLDDTLLRTTFLCVTKGTHLRTYNRGARSFSQDELNVFCNS